MSAGTIALTNNSANVTGTGTAFTTDLKAGDFIVVIVGGVTYTLGVKTITSATALTLITAYGGPTATGNAWTAVPNATLVGITAQVAADVAKAIRGLNLDKANWQKIFSSDPSVTVTRPDLSTFTGPSWGSLSDSLAGKADTTTVNAKAAKGANSDITSLSGLTTALSIAQGGTGATTASAARTALGLDAIGYTLLDAETKRTAFAAGRLAANSQGAGVWTFNNTPFGFSEQYGTCLQVSNKSTSDGAAGNGIWQHYLCLGASGNIIYASNINNVYSAYQLKSTKNTTIDSNGFIKSASPIYRLCDVDRLKTTDIESDDFILDGFGSANGEARGVSAARISEGIYQVNGSLGLSSDGWTIEVPQDVNGNRLLFVETEVSNEGRITIKTYKRKFDVESAMIIAGDPMDIPAGRWIDLRLEMPADTDFTDTDLPENNDGKELSS